MSKSTGNFLMLDEACELYSADAVRFALADAGDSLEDANFERKRADSAVTMLFVEEIFARAAMRDPTVGKKDQLQLRDGELSYFVDRAFKNELGAMIAETLSCYEAMRWRDGIQAGAFGLQLLRDAYRDWCAKSGVPMHQGLLVDYARVPVWR
jgi:leucyl-tRNA synthetase